MSSSVSLKRPHDFDNVDGEQVVDDLLFASAFAMIPANNPGFFGASGGGGGEEEEKDTTILKDNQQKDDNNEIDVDDDDDDEDNDDDNSKGGPNGEEGSTISKHDDDHNDDDDDDDDDDDTELHQDIAAAVAQMEAIEKEEGDDPSSSVVVPPKTENEVDGYRIPIHELESMLQLQLTVDHNAVVGSNPSSITTITTLSLDRKTLSPAGCIKNFMITDRTVVVESPVRSSASHTSSGPLDEGSLLVMEVPSSLVASNSDANEMSTVIVPLGRIFEVFGPVSQPLYSIRLPAPLTESKTVDKAVKSLTQKMGKEADQELTTARETVSVKDTQTSSDETDNNKTKIGEESEPSDDSVTKDTKSVEKPSDPWASNGIFTTYILQTPNVPIFYSQDEAKLIDTDHVLRSSGKGCDASNLFDEEVVNSNEIYYSDDEQEREAKNRQKGKNSKGRGVAPRSSHPQRRGHDVHQRMGQPSLPHGFHPTMAPPTNMMYPPQRALPQGFHSGPIPPPPPPPPPTPQYSNGPYPHYPYSNVNGAVFPPPPPANNPRMPPQNPRAPPPPRKPSEPPAYQY
ncbi:Gar1/Naf1 RNA binding region-containing protein [Nitzschia inconspicua]|uniref:Gar1/Naf1 RNA binding region-containing protein n=1 Tax=Nitzschia inconspicua TaxID=303405 RepID=A0A9K3PEL0_9STRA|nr:Gar1/Naf1 RNA binding region-containing protein [Nitzschia inconspicua]